MTDRTARDLLRQARDSLDDARLLAEHRRHNEIVLTRLALHQALQAISLGEGLDGSDSLPMQTLLRRVPRDHPQAERVTRLQAEMPTIAAVAALVEALDRPAPEPEPSPSGPAALTALALSPQGHGRAEAASGFPSAAFWTLMDRWRIGDPEALALIGHAGGLTRKGTRPRFRLAGDEAVRYAALRSLDAAIGTLGLAPSDWLATVRTEAPFGGDTPLAVLTRDGADGARRLVRALNRQGLEAALARQQPLDG